MNKVAVVGQGYVGLPLSMEICRAGFTVYGIDVDTLKIDQLNLGVSHISDVSQISLQDAIKNHQYVATDDFEVIKECDVVLICVPTPLEKETKLPKLTSLRQAVKSIGQNLQAKTLVVLESTVATGTTNQLVLDELISESKLNSMEFYLAFSPERIDPNNSKWTLKNTPKLVSGINKTSTEKALEFYSKFIDNIVEVSSIEVAETAKLLENSFRLINISFINELALFCNKLGIDINEVVQAAASKPYGFMPFYPSLGVGGHCIPVDPIYLSEKAKEVGSAITMIARAEQINIEIPTYYVGRAEEKIGGVKGKRIIVLGLAYKPNISDTRESPAESLIVGLRNLGAIVAWHDDLVGEWNGEKSVDLGTNYDLAILATPHDYFDLSKLGNVPILNTRGSL
jgi:UDP-N-acetyl-D-glucosamine dehydrogenase